MTSLRNTTAAVLALMRPAQWPILSIQLLVGVLLMSPAAQGGGCWLNSASPLILATGWLSWVVLLNGGTLAFNSAFDRDTGPVAYLPEPPTPPRGLAPFAGLAMVAGAVLGWLVVGPAFGTVTGACVLLSVLYSHRRTRWKSVPGLDLLVNMLGYGAGTTAAGLLLGRAAHLIGPDAAIAQANGGPHAALSALSACGVDRLFLPDLPTGDGWNVALVGVLWRGGAGWFVVGFGLLFGSFYPLTQIYQREEDLARGDRTLATALGIERALGLALALGAAAVAAFGAGLLDRQAGAALAPPAIAMVLWLGHLVIWRSSATTYTASDHERGMYRALTLWAIVDLALLAGWLL